MGEAKVGTLRFELLWAGIDPTAGRRLRLVGPRRGRRRGGAQRRPGAALRLQHAALGGRARRPRLRRRLPAASRAARRRRRSRPGGTFLAAAVARYGPDGEFWPPNPLLPELPIRDWQLWNEQNSPTFYEPKPNVERLREAARTPASKAIAREDPGAEIILGGMFGTPLGGRKPAIAAWDFLEKLYRARGRSATSTASRRIPTRPSSTTSLAQIDLLRDEMRDGRRRATPTSGSPRSAGRPDGPPNPLNRGPAGPGRSAEARPSSTSYKQAQEAQHPQRRLVLVAGQPGLGHRTLRVVSVLRPARRRPRSEAVAAGIH